jgi:hypothetical protein
MPRKKRGAGPKPNNNNNILIQFKERLSPDEQNIFCNYEKFFKGLVQRNPSNNKETIQKLLSSRFARIKEYRSSYYKACAEKGLVTPQNYREFIIMSLIQDPNNLPTIEEAKEQIEDLVSQILLAEAVYDKSQLGPQEDPQEQNVQGRTNYVEHVIKTQQNIQSAVQFALELPGAQVHIDPNQKPNLRKFTKKYLTDYAYLYLQEIGGQSSSSVQVPLMAEVTRIVSNFKGVHLPTNMKSEYYPITFEFLKIAKADSTATKKSKAVTQKVVVKFGLTKSYFNGFLEKSEIQKYRNLIEPFAAIIMARAVWETQRQNNFSKATIMAFFHKFLKTLQDNQGQPRVIKITALQRLDLSTSIVNDATTIDEAVTAGTEQYIAGIISHLRQTRNSAMLTALQDVESFMQYVNGTKTASAALASDASPSAASVEENDEFIQNAKITLDKVVYVLKRDIPQDEFDAIFAPLDQPGTTMENIKEQCKRVSTIMDSFQKYLENAFQIASTRVSGDSAASYIELVRSLSFARVYLATTSAIKKEPVGENDEQFRQKIAMYKAFDDIIDTAKQVEKAYNDFLKEFDKNIKSFLYTICFRDYIKQVIKDSTDPALELSDEIIYNMIKSAMDEQEASNESSSFDKIRNIIKSAMGEQEASNANSSFDEVKKELIKGYMLKARKNAREDVATIIQNITENNDVLNHITEDISARFKDINIITSELSIIFKDSAPQIKRRLFSEALSGNLALTEGEANSEKQAQAINEFFFKILILLGALDERIEFYGELKETEKYMRTIDESIKHVTNPVPDDSSTEHTQQTTDITQGEENGISTPQTEATLAESTKNILGLLKEHGQQYIALRAVQINCLTLATEFLEKANAGLATIPLGNFLNLCITAREHLASASMPPGVETANTKITDRALGDVKEPERPEQTGPGPAPAAC